MKRDWEWCGGAGGTHAGPMLGLGCWLPTFPRSPGCLLSWVSDYWNTSWSWVIPRFGASEGAPRSYSTVAAWCKASQCSHHPFKINHGPDFITINGEIWFQKWLFVMQKIAKFKKKSEQRCWYPKSVPGYIIGLLGSSLNPLSKLQLISQIKEERSFARPCLLSHAEAVVIF